MDEKTAIARLKQGDITGLETLVKLYYVPGVRTAFLITHDRGLAEDVVQGVFIRIFERASQFDQSRPFGPWLMRIVVNEALKMVTRGGAARETSLFSVDDGAESVLADDDPLSDPQTWLENLETRQEVWQALQQLSPQQRASLVLFYYLELSEAEAAGQLGCAVGTLKAHLHTARKRLRTLLTRTEPPQNLGGSKR